MEWFLLIFLVVGAALICVTALYAHLLREWDQMDNELEYLRWKERMRKAGKF